MHCWHCSRKWQKLLFVYYIRFQNRYWFYFPGCYNDVIIQRKAVFLRIGRSSNSPVVQNVFNSGTSHYHYNYSWLKSCHYLCYAQRVRSAIKNLLRMIWICFPQIMFKLFSLTPPIVLCLWAMLASCGKLTSCVRNCFTNCCSYYNTCCWLDVQPRYCLLVCVHSSVWTLWHLFSAKNWFHCWDPSVWTVVPIFIRATCKTTIEKKERRATGLLYY